MLHRWYSWLHSNIPGTGVTAVGQRLLLDQACFAPIFIPSFMATLLMLEGSAQPIAAAQEQWWPAIVANWKLWVPAQIVNFAIVPPHFQASRERDRTRNACCQAAIDRCCRASCDVRSCPPGAQVLFANGVAVCWNVYLSWATHRGAPAGADEGL